MAGNHQAEMRRNAELWQQKPVLRAVYRRFYARIAQRLRSDTEGDVVEIGSGIGRIREVIPDCVLTDLSPTRWSDRTEDAYKLSFHDGSVSNLILFDVLHHLAQPGRALTEFRRVLEPRGRIIILEPFVSLLGLLVYGLFHSEPLGLLQPIDWDSGIADSQHYYSAQANATKIFFLSRYRKRLTGWRIAERRVFTSLSYVASGGYSGRQLYPDSALPAMQRLDRMCQALPWIFGTRLLVVMEKQ